MVLKVDDNKKIHKSLISLMRGMRVSYHKKGMGFL